jgi:hypothetical protein
MFAFSAVGSVSVARGGVSDLEVPIYRIQQAPDFLGVRLLCRAV